ncbi:MAG: phage tail protein [Lachnospiraceae bacterium]|nr:phage tail protein [Lachnospiraceae bacterium]
MGSYEDLVTNYRFRVWIENQEVSFSKISGLHMEVKTRMISKGGTAQITAVPSKNPRMLKLQRGAYKDGTSLLDKLRPGMYLEQGIIIAVLGRTGEIVMEYAVDNAFVSRWEISDIDALSGQILIDTFEVVYTDLSILNKTGAKWKNGE